MKLNLKVKRFWGKTNNVVRIQICVAITAYCLMAIVQHNMLQKRSICEVVLQILSISLTDKAALTELSKKTNINDVKEQFGPLIPGLFD